MVAKIFKKSKSVATPVVLWENLGITKSAAQDKMVSVGKINEISFLSPLKILFPCLRHDITAARPRETKSPTSRHVRPFVMTRWILPEPMKLKRAK